ncbi:MAG: 4Fe-4S binding protein [Chloroflexi bacterium]|nr:4Fe-4S binding protein [Chloroflexota bacterium]
MGKKIATVQVFRQEAGTGRERRHDTFEVPWEADRNVLDVLRYIRDHIDGSLAFRAGCEGPQPSKCGACVVVVNGQPALSCQKSAELAMVVEPHWKFKVIKDLAVDLRSVVRQDTAREVPNPVSITIDPELCDGCGDCVAVCPTRVWKLVRRKAVPDDAQSCCGPDCGQCSQYCPQRAITVS